MNETAYDAEPVLVIGATGHLGGKIARLARRRGYEVRALVRAPAGSADLERLGIEVVPGNLLDRQSLDEAMRECRAVVATAIGYANRKRGDLRSGADTIGYRNVAEAVAATGVRRLVFGSVLTCDRASEVPHFWHKKLAEDAFEEMGVPFVSLRPGAFLDQGSGDFWAAGLREGRLRFAVDPDVRLTFVHTEDVARCFVDAVEVDLPRGVRHVDVGCDRAVSVAELARIASEALGRAVIPQVPPWWVVNRFLGLASLFDPWKGDLRAMMAYIRDGDYVADTTLQSQIFGPPPRIEEAMRRYLADIGLLQAAAASELRAGEAK